MPARSPAAWQRIACAFASLLLVLGCAQSGAPAKTMPAALTQDAGMNHYKNSEWAFELDIPKSWNRFPPVSSNSPFEIMRFASHENGTHLLIVFRNPNNPNAPLKASVDGTQKVLTKGGFSNFVQSETKIGSKVVMTLDFDKDMDGHPWHCRHYFIADGTLLYVLGFGTTDREAMFPVYDRMAQTFIANN
jgi:hypothetical protein